MWAECANTATDIHNIILKTADSSTPYKAFYGMDAPYACHLRTFGEIGVAKEHATVQSKLDDRADVVPPVSLWGMPLTMPATSTACSHCAPTKYA